MVVLVLLVVVLLVEVEVVDLPVVSSVHQLVVSVDKRVLDIMVTVVVLVDHEVYLHTEILIGLEQYQKMIKVHFLAPQDM
tara:strand:- start:35 stop:274 length:240 start_codon:yes stop_codon:yes gene_type:complete